MPLGLPYPAICIVRDRATYDEKDPRNTVPFYRKTVMVAMNGHMWCLPFFRGGKPWGGRVLGKAGQDWSATGQVMGRPGGKAGQTGRRGLQHKYR